MPQHPVTISKLSIINERPRHFEGPELLHELVAPSSTATAIDFLEHGSKRRKLSYEALHRFSDALAQKIIRLLGTLKNASAIIPVLLPQCPELYIVLLAILKTGKAFCPINPDTPKERLAFILKDISAELLITDSAHGKSLEVGSKIIKLHPGSDLFQDHKHNAQMPISVHTTDLAYVLYTSGSTGLPKAVSVSHRAVTQSLIAHDRHIPTFSRFLQFAAPTFDVSIFEIFFPWFRGRTLSSRTRTAMLNELPETIRMLNVDAAELTPTVVSNLLQGRQSVPGLKLLLTIGEMLTEDVIAEYGASDIRDGILWAMYGPTEAAIHCTLQPRISATATVGTIGLPLDTVSAFITIPIVEGESNSIFSIAPVGEEGELVVGGYQIAEEYLNRRELTAASFVHHPEYGYLYRTGDRARLRSDGLLECLGRVSTGQVKLNGQRIELGEIEQVIMKTNGCRAAAVLILEDRLVAFCATGSKEISQADIMQVSKQWLPKIMLPSDVVLMRTMPQLPSGKIDKTSLATAYRQNLRHNRAVANGPETDVRHPVFDLLKHYLRGDLTLSSNLASAGLDSLKAIRLASMLRVRGYSLTALQLLSATTAKDVLAATNKRPSTNRSHTTGKSTFVRPLWSLAPELEAWRTEIAYTLPCTPIQEAMLAETAARPQAYCNWLEIELSEQYTFESIESALRELVQGNEILRSGFHPTGTRDRAFTQIVWTGLRASQLRQVGEFSRSYSLDSQESIRRPLSIQVKIAPDKPRLLFQIHHALYDGWSLDLILQDLEIALQGKTPTRRPQFRDVVQYHVDLDPESLNGDRDYWASLLDDRPQTKLPNLNGTVLNTKATNSFRGRSTIRTETLFEHSRTLAVNPQVFFQAAVSYIMSLYVDSCDIVIGNVTSGRTIPVIGVEDIIGPCIASLPFRLRFDRLREVQDVLHEAQRLNRESLEHCSLPLREIAKAVGAQPGTPLFDVLFVWQQSLHSTADSTPPIRLVESADELEFRLTLEYEPHPDHVSYRATFDPSTIPEKQVKHLARQIDEIVQYFLDNPDSPTADITQSFAISSISVANPIPRQEPLRYGPSYAVERWARDTPDKAAIAFYRLEKGVMQVTSTATYATLNLHANQLACILKEQGVRPGYLVGIVMEKSVDLYVAILAVSKLNAGYLPLVPDLPHERMRRILHESQIAVCISDASASLFLRSQTSCITLCMGELNLSANPGHDINMPYDGTHVAYAIFTSGSTGTPKGVLVTHDNLMSNINYLAEVYPYTTESRLLQACSQAFDVSVFEIFFSWHIGICLCTATRDDLFVNLEDAVNKMSITHLSLTPTVAALLDPKNVPTVRFLVTAGEAVTENVRRKWAGRGLYQGEYKLNYKRRS